MGSAVVVVLALTAAVFFSVPAEDAVDSPPPLRSRIGVAAKAALAAMGSDEEGFEAAREELLKVIEARRENLPGDSHATVTENLEIIESQIAAISDELSRDPDNPRLARILAEAYQREIELLQMAAALPSVPAPADES
jgi:hypothetical protein